MIREALANYPWPALSCLALLIFLVLFFAVLLWIRRREGKAFYSYMENLPLQEEGRHEA